MPAAKDTESHFYQTFPEILLANFEGLADKPALKFVNRSGAQLKHQSNNQSNNQSCETISFKQLEKLAFGQAVFLKDKLKDVSTSSSNQSSNQSDNQKFVAVLSASGIEYLLSILGQSLLETVPVLLSTRNTQTINQHLIEESGCCAIIHSKEYEKQAQSIKQSLKESNNQEIVLIEMPSLQQAWSCEADASIEQSIKQSIQETVSQLASQSNDQTKQSNNQSIHWALCLHTSGTTGLFPKLVRLNDRWVTEIWRGDTMLRQVEQQVLDEMHESARYQSENVVHFVLSPLFHAAGVIGAYAALMLGECMALYTGDLWPPTPEQILNELTAVQATTLETVPFLIEQVVEYLHAQDQGVSTDQSVAEASQGPVDGSVDRSIDRASCPSSCGSIDQSTNQSNNGWNILQKLDRVNYGGASLPPSVGHALVEHGVNVVSFYGSSEAGFLSRGYQNRLLNRGRWCEMRMLPNAKYKFISRPDLDDKSARELVILKGSPNMSLSQSNTPEGDWRTGDLFKQDLTDPYLFTVNGRIDDLIVHVTGEKTSPGPIEQGVMAGAENVVERCCVVGQKRFNNCLLVEVKPSARHSMTNQAIEQAVWEALQLVNTTIPRHSVVPQRMIAILPEGSKIPTSDKGSIKRKLVDKQFGELIESLYTHFGDVDQSKVVLKDWKSEEQINEWLNKEACEILDESEVDNDVSLFSQGLDSLTAVSLRKTIAEHFSTIKNLPENLVYQVTSIVELSKYLFNAFNSNEFHSEINWLAESEKMFQQYASSDLIKSSAADLENIIRTHAHAVDVQSEETRASPTHKRVYLITGSTGSLGNFILDQLLKDDATSKVYCAVRGSATDSSDTTFNKLAHAWSERGFPLEPLMKARAERRLITFACQLSDPSYKIGASDELYSELASDVTHIIHGAWKMDFNSMITEFEQSCIRPSYGMLLLSGLGRRKHFTFISSISSCLAYPGGQAGNPDEVPEGIHDHPEWAHSMGYGQSKLCVERLTRVFYDMGMCNSAEVVRVGQIMGDTVHGHWNTAEHIPLLIKAGQIMHKMPAHYFGDLIDWVPVNCIAQAISQLISAPEKSKVGVSNLVNPHTINWPQFLDVLRQCGMKFEVVPGSEWAGELASGDVKVNPAVKLAHFFEQSMSADQSSNQSASQSTEQPAESVHPIKFATVKTAQRSPVIKDLPPVNAQWMQTCIHAWQEQGFLTK